MNKFQKNNRFNNIKSDRTKYWCGGCDMQLVSHCKKCLNCGTRNNLNKKVKKFKNNYNEEY